MRRRSTCSSFVREGGPAALLSEFSAVPGSCLSTPSDTSGSAAGAWRERAPEAITVGTALAPRDARVWTASAMLVLASACVGGMPWGCDRAAWLGVLVSPDQGSRQAPPSRAMNASASGGPQEPAS